MPRKIIAVLIAMLLSCSWGAVFAKEPKSRQKEVLTVDEVKAKLSRIGLGDEARLTVRLKNGSKVKGYITIVGQNEFVVYSTKDAIPVRIAFSDVEKIEDNRPGFAKSLARSVAIGAGVGAGIIAVLVLVACTIDD
jgi:hypothetical protein